MGLKYFLDTYAIYELISFNPNYAKYHDAEAMTCNLNLMELFYGLSKVHPKFGEKNYEFFKDFLEKYDDETIKEAMLFRLKHKKKKFSYVDCIGYVMARKNGALFLTGDKEFGGMEGVEFVK